MNILQGLEIQGLTLNTEENFNSIPGLWQWNDARDRIELASGSTNRVTFWGDKSIQTNNFTRVSLKAPIYERNLWLYSNDSALYLNSPRRDYTFLHNGSKFGMYLISKNSWTLDQQVGLFGALNFASATGTGLQGTLASQQNGRYGFILRGGTQANVTKTMTNILNTGSTNYSPSERIYTQSFVNFGQELGIKITYGNAVANLTPFYQNLADYPQGPHTNFYCITGIAGQTPRVGLILIYNWTGYSDLLVQEFDARVRLLLNKEKLIFENLDLQ